MDRHLPFGGNIGAILGSIKAVPVHPHFSPSGERPPRPFVTISRQPGAGALKVAAEFVDRINSKLSRITAPSDDTPPQWTCWDRELVEKVASDHHLSTRLIDSIEN